jgi:uncharacterized protein with gpF-like domain
VRLIRSLAEDQLARAESVIQENFGVRAEVLSAKLEAEFDVTESCANLIARDQTLKLNGQLTKVRQQGADSESPAFHAALFKARACDA